jgi:hypothetical protein
MAELAKVLPPDRWPDSVFVDAFLGGGSVSLRAKALGLEVRCNDIAERSAIFGRAVIDNGAEKLTPSDAYSLLREPAEPYPQVAEKFVPGSFASAGAGFIDRALYWLTPANCPEPLRSLLLLWLVKFILRLQPGSVLRSSDAAIANDGELDGLSAKRADQYLRSRQMLSRSGLLKLMAEVNAGVIPGRGETSRMDALDFLASVVGDVVYLDPPYPGTTAYEREYEILDVLLEGKALPTSRFSKDAGALKELFAACEHIPVWVVSLNNSVLQLEDLLDLIRVHRRQVDAVSIPYRHLGPIASRERNLNNREFIIVARD